MLGSDLKKNWITSPPRLGQNGKNKYIFIFPSYAVKLMRIFLI